MRASHSVNNLCSFLHIIDVTPFSIWLGTIRRPHALGAEMGSTKVVEELEKMIM
jgi:hypothetical protein